jgi:hypothetical protein
VIIIILYSLNGRIVFMDNIYRTYTCIHNNKKRNETCSK